MRRAPALALLALGCALAAAAAGTGPYLTRTRDVEFELGRRVRQEIAERRPVTPLRTDAGSAPWWENVVTLVLAGLVAAGVLFLLFRFLRLLYRLVALWLRPSAPGRATVPYDAGEESYDDAKTELRRRVVDELTALSADLDALPDPREAVIACYVRMEHAFATAGAGRTPDESPLELVARVLGELSVPEADVRRLTALFTEARFSGHPVTDEMRTAARRSLRNVVDALAVPS